MCNVIVIFCTCTHFPVRLNVLAHLHQETNYWLHKGLWLTHANGETQSKKECDSTNFNVQYEKYQTEDMQKETKTKALGEWGRKGESLAHMHTIHVEIHV